MGQTTPLRVLDAPLLAFLGPLHKGPQRVVDEELGDEAGAVLPLQLDRSVAIILPRLDLLLFVSRAPPSHRTAPPLKAPEANSDCRPNDGAKSRPTAAVIPPSRNADQVIGSRPQLHRGDMSRTVSQRWRAALLDDRLRLT